MRLQTILHQVEKFKSLVYGAARFEKRDAGSVLVVHATHHVVSLGIPVVCASQTHLRSIRSADLSDLPEPKRTHRFCWGGGEIRR